MSPGTSKSTTVEGPGTHQKTRKVTPYKSTFCSNINISHLGVYLKKGKTLIGKDTCTLMFTEALLTTAKKQKQPVSINRWVNKEDMRYIYIYTHPPTYIHTSHKKDCKFPICNNMDGVRGYYVKLNKSEEDKYCKISLTCTI